MSFNVQRVSATHIVSGEDFTRHSEVFTLKKQGIASAKSASELEWKCMVLDPKTRPLEDFSAR